MTTQGKALTPADKETIVALKKYFDRTKNDLQEQASPSVQRVVNALGVGIATVKRVMADHNRGVSFTKQEKIHTAVLVLPSRSIPSYRPRLPSITEMSQLMEWDRKD